MVISLKILQREMGYRGSKLITDIISFYSPTSQNKNNKSAIIKEQRVDGSYIKLKSRVLVLRCTLMGLEKGHLNINSLGLFSKIIESSTVKILTKVLVIKNSSTLSSIIYSDVKYAFLNNIL